MLDTDRIFRFFDLHFLCSYFTFGLYEDINEASTSSVVESEADKFSKYGGKCQSCLNFADKSLFISCYSPSAISAMAFDNKRALWLTAGVLSGLGSALCIAELRKFIREKCTRKPLSKMEDSIRLEDLEVLVRSPNYSLRKSAEQVVLDRAMKDHNLDFIANACYSRDELQILKAVVALAVLVKNAERVDRDKMIEHGVLESLSHALVNSVQVEFKELVKMGGYDFRLQRCASESLFHLIYDDDSSKIRLMQCNSSIVRVLLKLISETRNKEVMRWSLFTIHQLSACESLRPVIAEKGVIPTVSEMLVRNQGDFVLMRTCLHTMVMFVNNNTEDEVVHLKEMAKYDIFRPAVVSLRAGE